MRGSSGGRATAVISRQKALDRYYDNPKFCKECGIVIQVKVGEKIPEVKKRDFCNHSCAAKFNNRKRKKPRVCELCGGTAQKTSKRVRKLCDACLDSKRLRDVGKVTKGSLFERRGSYQSARSTIRRHAEMVFNSSGRERVCVVCGYSSHVEVAHRLAVAKFPKEATLEEINSLDNLVGLCPNHHWEFDEGLLKFDAVEWNGLPFKTHTLEIPGSTPEDRNQL